MSFLMLTFLSVIVWKLVIARVEARKIKLSHAMAKWIIINYKEK